MFVIFTVDTFTWRGLWFSTIVCIVSFFSTVATDRSSSTELGIVSEALALIATSHKVLIVHSAGAVNNKKSVGMRLDDIADVRTY